MVPSTYAVIVNGEPAIDVLGQFTSPSSDTTADYVKGCLNNGASPLGFIEPSSGTIDPTNHWLFIADSGNNRVLVFPLNTNNTLASKTASYVLGQQDFVSCYVNGSAAGTANAAGLYINNNLFDLAVDPTNECLMSPTFIQIPAFWCSAPRR